MHFSFTENVGGQIDTKRPCINPLLITLILALALGVSELFSDSIY